MSNTTVQKTATETTHVTKIAATVQSKSNPPTTVPTPTYHWLDIFPVIGILFLYLLAVRYVRRTEKGKQGKYRVSYLLNIIPMAIAVFAAGYPIKLGWLPETQFYGLRLIGWTAFLILATRFLWTLYLQFDNDGILLQGDPRELDSLIDEKVNQIWDTEKVLLNGQLMLFDKAFRNHMSMIKNSNLPESYYFASGIFLEKVRDKANRTVRFEMGIWTQDEMSQDPASVPDPYWKTVKRALEDREVVPYRGTGNKANGVAFYAGNETVVLVACTDGKLLNTNHVLNMWRHFDSFWTSL